MRPVRTFDFIVVLKKDNNKTIDIISLLMLGLAVVFFIFNIVTLFYNKSQGFNPKIILYNIWVAVIVGVVFYNYKKQKQGFATSYRFALLIAAFGWFSNPKTLLLAIVYVLAALLERSLKVAPEYAFDENEIVTNSLPQKKYKWSEISNVVLRFGMLTIDYKNNKIFQGEVNDEVSLQVENDFNEFCKTQLAKNNS